jgi:DNA-binding LacI/PurR family transcriptional regulator/predicted transcriptional regulator of viral defense system
MQTFIKLKELTDGQSGYFTAGQASDLGYAHSQQIFHSRKGNWQKIFRNLYRLPGHEDTPKSEFIKFSLLSIGRKNGPKAVLRHESALFHYGLLDDVPDETVLTVPHSFRSKMPDGCKIYKKKLDKDEFCSAGVFKVTNISRTLHDMSEASLMTRKELDKIVMNAFEKKLLSQDELESCGLMNDEIGKYVKRVASSPEFQRMNGNGGKFAVLALRSKGHLYGDMHSLMVLNLQKKGIIPISIHFDENPEIIKKELDAVMSLKPASIIIEGLTGTAVMDYLESKSDCFDSVIYLIDKPEIISGKFKSHFVLTDWWYGSYSATKYLLGLGHRKIVLISHKWLYSPEQFRISTEYRFEEGYRMALKEAGCLEFEQYFYDDFKEPELTDREFLKLLKSKKCPSAILSLGDVRITSKMDVFRKAGIKIPDDISVVGYYNTPLSKMTSFPFTSVSIKEEEIATRVAEIVAGDTNATEITIRPELVIRKSCRELQ